MPVQTDWSLVRFEDGLLTIGLSPPTPIGGWNIRFQVVQRLGGSSGLITKSMASGFYNVSGMNVVNSGQGVMSVTINSIDTSGLNPGTFSYAIERLDSGFRTMLAEGGFVLLPN